MIEMKYGRKDAVKPEDCVDEGNLPAGNKPFPDADNAQVSFVFPLAVFLVSCFPSFCVGRLFFLAVFSVFFGWLLPHIHAYIFCSYDDIRSYIMAGIKRE